MAPISAVAALLVPCHGVRGAGGALTGSAGRLERKRALLALDVGICSVGLAELGAAIGLD